MNTFNRLLPRFAYTGSFALEQLLPGLRGQSIGSNLGTIDLSGVTTVNLPSNFQANGIIVPTYETIQFTQNQLAAASFAVSTTLFVNDSVSGTYKVAGFSGVWGTASSSGIAKLEVATGTQAIASGTSQTSTGIDTSTTANTANNVSITTQTTISAGARVNIIWSGTVTSLLNACFSIVLQRLS